MEKEKQSEKNASALKTQKGEKQKDVWKCESSVQVHHHLLYLNRGRGKRKITCCKTGNKEGCQWVINEEFLSFLKSGAYVSTLPIIIK